MNKIKIGLSFLCYPVTMAHFFWRALERRDDVEIYSVCPFFDDWIPWGGGLRLPRKYVKVPTVCLPQNAAQLNMPYEIVANQLPDDLDLFLQIDAGFHFATRPKARIAALVKTDPHALSEQHYRIPAEYSDFVFGMQTPYLRQGEIYLPYAYDPTIHYPVSSEKIYDACLIGLHYDTRNRLVMALQEKGYKVHYSIGEVYDEYRLIYNQSKVALSWSSLLDLPARNWEALAMGLPLVCNRVPDMSTFFVENDHYLGFDTLEEAVSQVSMLLEDGDKAGDMGNRAYRKITSSGHRWDDRICQILELVKLI